MAELGDWIGVFIWLARGVARRATTCRALSNFVNNRARLIRWQPFGVLVEQIVDFLLSLVTCSWHRVE